MRKVAIAVYAGAAGLVLPPTPGNQKEIILEAFDKLIQQLNLVKRLITSGAASVAKFGMLLRDSEQKGRAFCPDVITLAENAKGVATVPFIILVLLQDWAKGK